MLSISASSGRTESSAPTRHLLYTVRIRAAIVNIGSIHFYYTLPHPLLYSNFNLHFPFSSVLGRNFRLRRPFTDCLQKKSKKVKFTY